MDVRSDNDGHNSSEATSEEMMHKSPYEIQEEEEKKAYEKRSKMKCLTVSRNQ